MLNSMFDFRNELTCVKESSEEGSEPVEYDIFTPYSELSHWRSLKLMVINPCEWGVSVLSQAWWVHVRYRHRRSEVP